MGMAYSYGYRRHKLNNKKSDKRCYKCLNYMDGICNKFSITISDLTNAEICKEYSNKNKVKKTKKKTKKKNPKKIEEKIKSKKEIIATEAKKKVVITVRGSNKPMYGCYAGMLEYNGYVKKISRCFDKNKFNEITSNRMIVEACIEAVKMLKEPCKIELRTTTATGIGNKKYKGINKDLTGAFDDLIDKSEHELEIKITEDGQYNLMREIALITNREKIKIVKNKSDICK